MDYVSRGNSGRQPKVVSTAAKAGPRAGRPPASDERNFVLPLFRQAGRSGINRLQFLQGTGPLNGRLVTQVGRLIHQLEAEGFVFLHERRNGERFVTYVLAAEPMQAGHPAPPKPSGGWRGQNFDFARPGARPDAPKKPVASVQATLFEGTASGSRGFLDFESGKLNW